MASGGFAFRSTMPCVTDRLQVMVEPNRTPDTDRSVSEPVLAGRVRK